MANRSPAFPRRTRAMRRSMRFRMDYITVTLK
jgi:hypothetical protein